MCRRPDLAWALHQPLLLRVRARTVPAAAASTMPPWRSAMRIHSGCQAAVQQGRRPLSAAGPRCARRPARFAGRVPAAERQDWLADPHAPAMPSAAWAVAWEALYAPRRRSWALEFSRACRLAAQVPRCLSSNHCKQPTGLSTKAVRVRARCPAAAMVYNIFTYRRPARVGTIATSKLSASPLSPSPSNSIPDALSFDRIVAGGTCPVRSAPPAHRPR